MKLVEGLTSFFVKLAGIKSYGSDQKYRENRFTGYTQCGTDRWIFLFNSAPGRYGSGIDIY